MAEEIWKPVVNFAGYYEVSNKGRVRSVSRIDSNNHVVKGTVLKPFVDKWGYEIVGIHKDGKRFTRRVHRLVAEAFIPNPNNYPEINHKNRNKTDNLVSNLEWCTDFYNQHYDQTYVKANKATSIPVVAIKDNYIAYVFPSANEAARHFNAKNGGSFIMRCIKHKKGYKTAYGYYWDYLPIKDSVFKKTYEPVKDTTDCPYCHSGSNLKSRYNGSVWDNDELNIDYIDDKTGKIDNRGKDMYADLIFNPGLKYLQSWAEGTDPLTVEISYCPFCGRKL